VQVLVVGDPGLGKSQMLRAACALAPRSVYVSANTTTAAGLTVTVSKESGGGGDVVLEAGALVLSDQGVCCIDEFDKVGCDAHCLLEAMEQQSVSVAKSGIVASLSARCSVLAAANPAGGHYDSAKTINENVKMSAALLSRFDLVFILLDKPDEAHDRRLSEYIMRAHAVEGQPSATRFAAARGGEASRREGPSLEGANRVEEQFRRGAHAPPIPPDLLRKYILYARKYVHPRLTGEAATVLQGKGARL
jgi:DNA helicase MCM8